MTAKWTLGNVPIFVSEYDGTRDIYRAEIKILDAIENELQFFGAGSRKKKLKGIVVSENNNSSLEIASTSDLDMALYGPYGLIGTYKINSLSSNYIKYASAVIDGESYFTDTSPLYEVELELVEA